MYGFCQFMHDRPQWRTGPWKMPFLCERFCGWDHHCRYRFKRQNKGNRVIVYGSDLWFSLDRWFCGGEEFCVSERNGRLSFLAGCGWCDHGRRAKETDETKNASGSGETGRGDDEICGWIWRKRKSVIFLLSGTSSEKMRKSGMERADPWGDRTVWKDSAGRYSDRTSEDRDGRSGPQSQDLWKDDTGEGKKRGSDCAWTLLLWKGTVLP